MLIIKNGSQVEPCLESNYEKTEELNGPLQISFDSFEFNGNPGHSLIDFETTIEDEDGHQYIVKQLHSERLNKRVVATHEYFEFAHKFKYDIYGGTRTFKEYVDYIFKDTGWTVSVETSLGNVVKLIPNFGEANILKLVDTICSTFGCEREIRPNKNIYFTKKVGSETDEQFRYAHNIKTISYNVDTTNLKTQIRGYGGNGLVVTYTSPTASSPRIGVRVAEPYKDEDILTEIEMVESLKNQIDDTPDTTIEVSVTKVDGDVGDYIWLIHEPLGLTFSTRILSKKTKREYYESTVTVGNRNPKSIEDVIINQSAVIDRNNKVSRSRFEQTDERITMEVERIGEDISNFEIRADAIETNVINVKNNLQSSINQTASEIRSEVAANVGTINSSISTISQKANQIQSTVTTQGSQLTNLGSRVASAESTITQQAGEISSKVSQTSFNGNTISSLINQTATTIKLKAEKIEFEGEVFGEGATFEGEITTYDDARVGNNVYLGSLNSTATKKIYFNNDTSIQSNGSSLDLYSDDIYLSGYDILLNGDVEFVGSVDLSSANVYGLGDVAYADEAGSLEGYTYQDFSLSDTLGLGFGYSSSSNRLYVRIHGSNMGYIDLS